MSEYISKKLISFLFSKIELTYEDKEKVRYIVKILVGEIGKTLLLGLLFFGFHEQRNFFLALIVVMLVKTFAGGIHEKNNMQCFVHSICFFTCCIISSKYVPDSSCIMPET